ncbi:Zinc finger with ufm1-specific peptidase domain protein-like [Plakobranchus ocellatus]|uniref:Zinc finger with ufm1-specific peptidase domain protein-like n=1 Tax=Plakobranchus ocellatus TaxID=259542 RepID=A0AAV3YPM5_9GAST|nr:Zinc finger with ufm1-specific peptidase domain protein-like [Plakobranchus ocellatus]
MAQHVQTHGNDPTYYGISVNDVDSFAHSHVPDAFHNELVCPMCGQRMTDADLLTSHVETHFSPQHCPSENGELAAVNKENIPENKNRGPSTGSSSWELKAVISKAKPSTSALSSRDQAVRPPSTNSAFSSKHQNGASPLSAKDVSSYRRQYERSLEQAVLKGKMSVADYHEQRAELKGNDLKGVDDGYSRVDGLIEHLNRLYRQQARPGQRAYLCSPMSHFSGSHGDRGWGCGYRNFQMMLSSLVSDPEYAHRIFKGGQVVIPSVPKVQQMIESAWRKGFDQDGCRQLRGSLVNTQKWIGATEIVATLASLGVKCRLVDFHAPSAPDGSHPRLLEWVTDYFTTRRPQQFTPPLYLQHQGHSRTIVGVDIDRDTRRLLLFDPGSKRDHLASLAATGLNWKCMRTFRRTQAGFRARQYQIVEVTGLLTDREYEESKIIKSERV